MNPRSEEFRKNIADMFVRSLEEEPLTWRKQWAGGRSAPRNAVTGTSYKGINRLVLNHLAMVRGSEDGRWATFEQIKKQGWHLMAGAKGVKVEYWMPYDTEIKKPVTWDEYKKAEDQQKYSLMPKYYTVFNAKDIEGIPVYEEPTRNIDQNEAVSKIIRNMGIQVSNDGAGRAFYRITDDTIHMPEKNSFTDDYSYNATLLHELSHATGAENRLNRPQSGSFGTPEYAYEELVAEISSCFMASEFYAEPTEEHMNNHKAYVQSWIREIQDKPDTLFKAIKDAGNAADYLEHSAELISEEKYKWRTESVFARKKSAIAQEKPKVLMREANNAAADEDINTEDSDKQNQESIKPGPRRYTFDKDGNAERLWHGKKVSDFTPEDVQRFSAELDADLNKIEKGQSEKEQDVPLMKGANEELQAAADKMNLELLKKVAEISSQQFDLVDERTKRETEFKAYISEANSAIEELGHQQQVLLQSIVDNEVRLTGGVSQGMSGTIKNLGFILRGNRVADASNRTVHAERLKGFVVGEKEAALKPRVVYGNNVDEILDKAGEIAKADGNYKDVNIGELGEDGKYSDFRQYDIAERIDKSPVYLKIPYMEKEEFTRTITELKEKGARFNSYSKRWYIPYDADFEKFSRFIPEDVKAYRRMEEENKRAAPEQETVQNMEAASGGEHFRFFYAGHGGQDTEAADYQIQTGYKRIWGSDEQGLNGETWVVYRDASDLPKYLQKYAMKQEERMEDYTPDGVTKAEAAKGRNTEGPGQANFEETKMEAQLRNELAGKFTSRELMYMEKAGLLEQYSREHGVLAVSYRSKSFQVHFYPDTQEEKGAERALKQMLSNPQIRAFVIDGKEYAKDVMAAGAGYRLTVEEAGKGYPPLPFAAVRKNAAGFYENCFINYLSGNICPIIPRQYDTLEMARNNIPEKMEQVNMEKLEEYQKNYGNLVDEVERDKMKEGGFRYSDKLSDNMRLLDQSCNKSFTLREVADMYNGLAQQYSSLEEEIKGYVKAIGDECRSQELLKAVESEVPCAE